MRIPVKSFFSISRFYIFLGLLIVCILMLVIESFLPKNWSNHLIGKPNFKFFESHTDQDDDLQRLKDYEAGDLEAAEHATTPKLPFSLDRFGDYEPVFLSHKIIHLDRQLTKNEKNFFKSLKSKTHQDKDNSNELLDKQHDKKLTFDTMKKSELNSNDKIQNKSSINKPSALSSTSSYLIDGSALSSSKQSIFKRHMLSSSQSKKSLNLNKLTESVRKINEQNPLSLLRFEAKDIMKVNRIYLLSYFRSGSSFLGDLLQQNYRTFYQFEPLHFRSVASRLPTNDSKTDNSISLVLHMVNQCNFRSKATTNYLNWISKDDNKFLLSWNRFLYSLCRFNQTKCSDSNFVEQVCNLAEQRVTKLTRVNLDDLVRVMKQDNSFEDYIRSNLNLTSDQVHNHLNLNSTKLVFRINSTDNQVNKTTSSLSEGNASSIIVDSEPIKIIYLVRDPRAIYSSRQYLSWCKNRASCANIDKLCDEMNSDFRTFESLYTSHKVNQSNGLLNLVNNSTKYPIQLFLIRFEKLALEPFKSTSELFKMVNLDFKENIKRFVFTHTASPLDMKNSKSSPFKKWYLNKVSNDPHSTKRNSSKIPFDWINRLSFTKIDEIQTKCRYSMNKLGYKLITNEQFNSIPKSLTDHLLVDKINFTLF